MLLLGMMRILLADHERLTDDAMIKYSMEQTKKKKKKEKRTTLKEIRAG